ncbi:MAG: DUF2867 domain-containing protein [Rhodobacteraceae bacterium]|nr:DUF2867 domain-containing protein [Paracoccaceae bacterium]
MKDTGSTARMIRPDRPADWSDGHQGPVRPDISTAREAFEQGFLNLPGWVGFALNLRNRIVGLFGLTTTGPDGQEMMLNLPVIGETSDRYEVGLIDRHLTFTITTELTDQRLKMTTSIWYNHWVGRAYLALVLIPHKIIVRLALRGVK